MSEPKWTSAQKDAISAHGGSLLVSAAAGSGKTAVLVQRVTEMLTRSVNTVPADKLLIVTFTNAAAAEMRGRLAARISKLLAEQPDNTLLAKQQLLLESAHISTIHSFCGELLRENFEKLGVSQDFTIADTYEMKLLLRQALDNIMKKLYEEDEPVFSQLLDYFSSGRDDVGLRHTIKRLFDFTSSHPFPNEWMKEKLAYYQELENHPWEQTIVNHCFAAFDYCTGLLDVAISASEENVRLKTEAPFQPFLLSLRDSLLSLYKAKLPDIFNTLKSVKFPVWRKKGFESCDEFFLLTAIRDELKDILKEIRDMLGDIFSESVDLYLPLHSLYPMIAKLFTCVTDFRNEFTRLKRQRNTLDFSDLEHLTIRLLVNKTENGWERTQIAREYGERFHEIMVDEYQDVNEAQEMIFRAVSKDENNLFMVGDVKQSIYRFRHARPELFLARRTSYFPYDRENEKFPAVITLDRNFRSSKGVLDFTNFVFRQLMSQDMGDVDYCGGEELVHGGGDTPPPGASLYVIDRGDEPDHSESTDILEARCIADIIGKRLADGTAQGYSDFSILLRSYSEHAHYYVEQLAACGVPAVAEAKGDFLSLPEVSAIISLLRVIDNPMQDVPLLAVMLSPIFGFTVDEVSRIRTALPKASLYEAVKQSVPDFLDKLSEFRDISLTMNTDRFIRYLYAVTDWENVVRSMANGDIRLSNLRYFVRCAKKYDDLGYESLSDFLDFLDKLSEAGEDIIPAALNVQRGGAVQIMSIHHSKGLEFPFCIIAGCAREFNDQERKGSLLLHPSYGAGLKTLEGETTLGHTAVKLAVKRDELSELLRVLYVAMTRAKRELVMVVTCKDAAKTLSKLSGTLLTASNTIPPYAVGRVNNFALWLLTAALRHPCGGALRTLADVSTDIVLPANEELQVYIQKPILETEDIINDASQSQLHIPFKLPEALTYQYSNEALSEVSVHAAASEVAERGTTAKFRITSKPAFLMDGAVSAREKGIAMHQFLQYANFSSSLSPEQEIERLVSIGLLTKKQAELIQPAQITAFFESKLGRRIREADQVLREYKFTVERNAGKLDDTLTGEAANISVILQGAADCVLIHNGEITIIDYKTDRTDSIRLLAERYAKQLYLYADAVSECLGLPVKECILYSFYLEKSIGVQK